jgi:hypothetical protein
MRIDATIRPESGKARDAGRIVRPQGGTVRRVAFVHADWRRRGVFASRYLGAMDTGACAGSSQTRPTTDVRRPGLQTRRRAAFKDAVYHRAQYNLMAKDARVEAGAPNPFIDPANCWLEADVQEAMFRAQLEMQRAEARP